MKKIQLKKLIRTVIKEQTAQKKSKRELYSQAQSFETSQPEEYQAAVDAYIAKGGSSGDVSQYKMPWLFFLDKWIGPYPWEYEVLPGGGVAEQKTNMSRDYKLSPRHETMVKTEIQKILRDPALGLTQDQQQKGIWIWLAGVAALIGKIIIDLSSGGGGGPGGGSEGGDWPPIGDEYLQ